MTNIRSYFLSESCKYLVFRITRACQPDCLNNPIKSTDRLDRHLLGLKDKLKDLLVDFKEANASSLDYLIYATMEGNCAAQYFTINRLIQQILVELAVFYYVGHY